MRERKLRNVNTAVGAWLVTIAVLAAVAPAGSAGVANRGIPGAPSNPLAGLPWGAYTGPLDGVYPAYTRLQGREQALMGKIALRPLTFWFGAWYPDRIAKQTISTFISEVTNGNRNVLAQVAVFRLEPWEKKACTSLPGRAAQASFKRWINNFAAGIGKARVALILQPDLPFALCGKKHIGSAVQLGLVRYAAKRFSAQSHTTVYIDAGAGDWERLSQAVWLLTRAGVRYTRGFSLNDTHYDSTGNELRFGARIVRALARHGIRGRHFVINTAANGSPFKYNQYYKSPHHGDPPACGDTSSHLCVTLGIPPTPNTADPRWGLSPQERSIATRYADAYIWESRPWLDFVNGTTPFDLHRALSMAATTPF